MTWSDIPRNPASRTLRQFAALCLAVFGFLATWQFLRGSAGAGTALAGLSLGLGLSGLVHPPALRRVYVGWLLATFPVAWIVSHAILAAVFYAVLTPCGLVRRLMGRDALRLKRPAPGASCWLPKPQPASVKQYFRQF